LPIYAAAYFIFAKQIFHGEAISLARKGKFHCTKEKPYGGFSFGISALKEFAEKRRNYGVFE
jgi:hypothetical protein